MQSAKHQLLAGKAPCSRNWTQIACPYWQQFSRAVAREFDEIIRPQIVARKGKPHAGGLVTTDAETSILQLLTDSGFNPSFHRTRETVDFAIGAARQPGRRALPQLIPDGMGPDTHLQVAIQLKHPFQLPPAGCPRFHML